MLNELTAEEWAMLEAEFAYYDSLPEEEYPGEDDWELEDLSAVDCIEDLLDALMGDEDLY